MKFLLVFICLFISVSCTEEKKPKSRPSTLKVKKFGGEFTLQGSQGDWSLSSTSGKLRVMYFGFTTCPDICPLALTKLNNVLKKLSPEKRAKIQPVFISVDYKRDTPAKVQEYVDFFGKGYVGLTGNKESIEKVVSQYGAYFEFVELKDSALKYTVDHTSRYYLIDQKGNFHKSYTEISKEPNFIVDVETLLKK
ncbi:MAG: SCO family protein [Bacteriovoracaceae bacterium]|nr:SCO family protein [Bacteriovoracaceae bacterium]